MDSFQDRHVSKFFAGILSVGDEVLEIDGSDVRAMTLEEVKDMILRKKRMLMRVMPESVTRPAL